METKTQPVTLAFCECGAHDGRLHVFIQRDGVRHGPFTEAIPTIVELVQLAQEGRFNKYKIIDPGHEVLERLPITSTELAISASKAIAMVAHVLPGLDPDMTHIVELIFGELKAEEVGSAQTVFKPLPLSFEMGDPEMAMRAMESLDRLRSEGGEHTRAIFKPRSLRLEKDECAPEMAATGS